MEGAAVAGIAVVEAVVVGTLPTVMVEVVGGAAVVEAAVVHAVIRIALLISLDESKFCSILNNGQCYSSHGKGS